MADNNSIRIISNGALQDSGNKTTGDEVKRKPPKQSQDGSLQQGVPPKVEGDVDSGYYDILVVGRTGMGKSSTVDKLMVLNTTATPEQNQQDLAAQPAPVDNGTPKGLKQTTKKKKKKMDKTEDGHREKMQCENVTGWIISEDQKEQEYFDIRIKNIVFSRQTNADKEPHNNVDELRNCEDYKDTVYRSSRSCQLLINEESKIQILDSPGFFSADLMEGASDTNESNLAVVRHIVRLQALAGLKFKRVLYFLPQPGPLKRADRAMQAEIQDMVKFFGVSIFKQMVLVATAAEGITEATDMSRERKFSTKCLKQSRYFFHEALVREFKEKKKDTAGLPTPPIIFITMTDTCEEILHMITSAEVDSNTGLQLEFNANTCCQCGIEIGTKEDDTLMAEYRGPGEAPWINALPYDETSCHPLMESKYTARSFFRGLARMFLFEWKFSEEQCISCYNGPAAKGCCKVHTMYEEDGYEPIEVNHTNEIDKPKIRRKVKTENSITSTTDSEGAIN